MKYSTSAIKILLLFILNSPAYSEELVIGTTYSAEATQHLIAVWQQQPEAIPIRTLNRTSASLKQLLTSSHGGSVDLVLSSSPMLFSFLQDKHLLTQLPLWAKKNARFVPEMIQDTTVAFSVSGYGLLSNRQLLKELDLSEPLDWDDLIQPKLYGMVIISTPSRSDTNHIMIETLLQRRGWQQGWALILQMSANLGTISSRSFGVADKIQAGLGSVGVVLDSYANLLSDDEKLAFHYLPNFVASPTYIAININSKNKTQAEQFVEFLMSGEGQQALMAAETGKFPISLLPKDNPLAAKQKLLLEQPSIDYELLIKRQELVRQLFDNAVSYRLMQLQDGWRIVYEAEKKIGHLRPELRAVLTTIPITEAQALDEDYLQRFARGEVLIDWQQFFLDNQLSIFKALEKTP